MAPRTKKTSDHLHGLTSEEDQRLTPADLATKVGAPPFTTPRRAAPSGGPAGDHDALGNPLSA